MIDATQDPLDHLRSLSCFSGQPAVFWPLFLETVAQACGARRVLLLARQTGNWRVFQQWPVQSAGSAGDTDQILQLAKAAATAGWAEGVAAAEAAGGGLAVRLQVGTAEAEFAIEVSVLVVLQDTSVAQRGSALSLVRLAADIPAHYEQARDQQRMIDKSERLFDMLSLSTRLGDETRFMKAALTLCNELSVRFACDRVALGWLSGPYIRLQTISHIERFDRHMAAAQQLESVMEETLDQDEEVIFPPPEGNTQVVRAHELHARTQGVGHLVSLPLRVAEQPVAVITAERQAAPFQEQEVWELRLTAAACASTLRTLHEQDRWLGARLLASAKAGLDRLWGVEHSLAKLITVCLVLTLFFTSLVRWPYRVEAAFSLHSREIVFVPAPFDGYLSQVYVEMGDQVAQQAKLAELDTRELVLEASSVAADVSRFAREVEKAMSTNALADMQIAAARRDQTMAHLDIIRRNIARAEVRSPMAGIIVEGDLKEKLSAPVRKGDLLFKVAKIENTYAELEIPEADVHEVLPGQQGEIAFVGRPDLRLPMRVVRIDPVATLKAGKNCFLARANIEFPPGDWWRPGMGGMAKVEIEDRPILWILTHRTIRFLQKVFWL
ncbi:MAG: efflux RND transporter periplasmic adaptor subunit [Magnetococcales bacterium]|nr:efflux RND transporter periplasmic adaptor subunit [Magnetococcales bacterium]